MTIKSNPTGVQIQKKWQIRGVTATGGKLAFPVMAFDYFEARKLAQAKAGDGEVRDIVLRD